MLIVVACAIAVLIGVAVPLLMNPRTHSTFSDPGKPPQPQSLVLVAPARSPTPSVGRGTAKRAPSTRPTHTPLITPTSAQQVNTTAEATTIELTPTVLDTTGVPTPTSSLTPTVAGQQQVARFLQSIAAAEQDVRSGRVEAIIRYNATTRSTATIGFHFGEGAADNRLSMSTTYANADGQQTSERLMNGTLSWQRQADQSWVPIEVKHRPRGELQLYLPHAANAVDASATLRGENVEVHWEDPSRGTTVTLLANATSGYPIEMRRLTHATGLTLVVTYTHWNMPVVVPERPNQ